MFRDRTLSGEQKSGKYHTLFASKEAVLEILT